MGAAARSYDHPRWSYDETCSPAARRSAARAACRASDGAPMRTDAHSDRHSQSRVRTRPEERAETRPSLRVVTQPRARFGAISLVAVLLGLALLAPVGLNSAMRRSQYQIAQLQQRQDDLIAERSTLRAEHASRTSTQRVKETADRLGMVTPAKVGFIDLGQAASGAATEPVRVSVAAGDDGALTVALASQESHTGQ
jgi:cell division protein FtsL